MGSGSQSAVAGACRGGVCVVVTGHVPSLTLVEEAVAGRFVRGKLRMEWLLRESRGRRRLFSAERRK